MLKVTIVIILVQMVATNLQSQFLGGLKNDRAVSFCQYGEGYVLSGSTRSFGAGSEDMWMIKVGEDMEDVFHKEWGTYHYDLASDIIATTDNHFLICGYSWDAPGGRTSIVLAKYDGSGNMVWVSYFGGYHNDLAYSLKESKDGGYLITGIDRSYGTLGAVFLVKTNASGVQEWSKYYDTANKDIGMDVAECSDSSFMILATTSTFIGLIANSSEYLTADASGIMVIKADKYGNEQWRKFYGGPAHDFAKKIVNDGNDNFYFVGSSMNNSNGSFDMTLHYIDIQGNVIWRKNYGGTGYEYGNGLDINVEGDLLLTGTSSSFSSDESPDIYVIKVDANGDELWSQTYGGGDSDYGTEGQFLSDGNLAIMGSSKSGTGSDIDIYFVKTDEEGNILKGVNEDIVLQGNSMHILFPNPSSSFIKISTRSKTPEQEIEFILYNITGQVIQRNTFSEPSKTIYYKNRLAQGIYPYTLKINKIPYTGKLIIN